jgi:hypothetical protein
MAIQNRWHELGQRARKAFRSHNNEIVSEAVKIRKGDFSCHRNLSRISEQPSALGHQLSALEKTALRHISSIEQ